MLWLATAKVHYSANLSKFFCENDHFEMVVFWCNMPLFFFVLNAGVSLKDVFFSLLYAAKSKQKHSPHASYSCQSLEVQAVTSKTLLDTKL